jgi:hypothetical protein
VQSSLGALALAQQAPASIAPVDSPDLEQFVRGPASLFQIMHISIDIAAVAMFGMFANIYVGCTTRMRY